MEHQANTLKTTQSTNNKWIVETDTGHKMGYLESFENLFHPNNIYFKLHVNKPSDLLQVGTLLINALKTNSSLSIQFNVMSTEMETIRLLCQNGFVKKRSCWEFSISGTHLKNIPLDTTSSIKLLSFDKLDGITFNRLQSLIVQHYKTAHESVNPVNNQLTIQQCFATLCEHISFTHSYYYQDKHSIFYCCCEIDGNDIFVTYMGYDGDNSTFLVFLLNVFQTLIQQYQQIHFEIDDINPYAMHISNIYSFTSFPSCDAYVWDNVKFPFDTKQNHDKTRYF